MQKYGKRIATFSVFGSETESLVESESKTVTKRMRKRARYWSEEKPFSRRYEVSLLQL